MRRLCWCVTALMLALPAARSAELPEFSLRDPADIVHTHRALLERGAVVVVTIPNVKHGDIQARYIKHLKAQLPAEGPRLVIVEDLSQSGVRAMALRSMKGKYRPGESTLLLLDENGALRRSLQVPGDETVVLIFDRNGKLVHRVTGLCGSDEAADASKKLAITAKALAAAYARETLPAVAEK